MKFIHTIQNNWTRVAISAVTIASVSSYAQTQDAETACKLIQLEGAYALKQDRMITDIFNPNNNTSYSIFAVSLDKNHTEFINKLESANLIGKLSQLAHDVGQVIQKYFGAFIGIFKQYDGKPSDQAFKFKTDMDRVFSPELAFSDISTKLQILLKEAEIAQETELIQIVEQLIGVLQKKKTEWMNKSSMTLLAGLTKRMGK